MGRIFGGFLISYLMRNKNGLTNIYFVNISLISFSALGLLKVVEHGHTYVHRKQFCIHVFTGLKLYLT